MTQEGLTSAPTAEPATGSTATRYWPAGKPRTLTLPRVGLMHNLRVSAERYPDKTALWFYGREVSYQELREGAERLAGHLKAQGIGKGDRVAVWLQNSPAWAVAAHAAWQIGAVVVPLAPMLQPREFGFFLQDAGIRVGVVGAELYEKAKQGGLGHAVVANVLLGTDAAKAGVPLPEGLNVTPELQEGDVTLEDALKSHPAPAAETGPEDLCVMPYTSGTTGLPKGCMHTHATVQANIFGAGAWVDTTVEDVFLATLPFFHVTGFVNSLLGPLCAGAKVVVLARWDRDAARELIRAHGATMWTNTATMVIDMMASPNFDPQDLRSLRNVTGGGASSRRPSASGSWTRRASPSARGTACPRRWPRPTPTPRGAPNSSVSASPFSTWTRGWWTSTPARNSRPAGSARSSSTGRRSCRATGTAPRRRPRRSPSWTANAFSARAIWGTWTRRGTSSSPTASSAW